MAVQPIVLYPASSLREASTDVTTLDEKTFALIIDLEDTLRAFRAFGVAGPQIGANVRVFVLSPRVVGGEDGKHQPIALINPFVEALGDEMATEAEGCLSFPGVRVEVTRATTCAIRFTQLNGRGARMDCDGMLARAVLHEVDHLDGKLLIDHAKPIKRQLIEAKAKKWAHASMRPMGGAA